MSSKINLQKEKAFGVMEPFKIIIKKKKIVCDAQLQMCGELPLQCINVMSGQAPKSTKRRFVNVLASKKWTLMKM